MNNVCIIISTLNILLAIITGIAIFYMSDSYIISILVALLINPFYTFVTDKPNFIGLLIFPLIEYFFNGSLTKYSIIYIIIVLVQVFLFMHLVRLLKKGVINRYDEEY